MSLAVEVWSLNHWTARGVPLFCFVLYFEPSSVPLALHTCLLIITMNSVSFLGNPYLPGED